MTQGTASSTPLRPVPECSDACVRSKARGASCAACALSCPAGAIDVLAQGIALDPDACTGCGQCAAACPAGALSAPPLPETRDQAVALTCSQAGCTGPTVGCVHAIGPEALSALWLSGTRQITLRIGDCDACPDGPDGAPFADALALVNRLLNDRGAPLLRLTAAPSRDTDAPESVARRRLFRQITSPLEDTPALARIQTQADGEVFAHTAEINNLTCTGCDACVQICPEGVLTLVKDGAGDLWYRSASSKCTGCQLCQDVCDSNAIELRSPGPEPAPVPLHLSRCPCCGVESHTPLANTKGQQLCRICRTAPHASNLFVVLPD